jgi:iron complex transport system ATP-binding protein
MKPLLSFERVSFSYGHRKVIADADFSIDTGACTALIGPNGGGKTTLLRLAADLLRPSTGQVLFEGAELRACSRRNIAQQIALVPQILDVPFSFTVQQIVEQGRTPYLGLFGGLSTRDRIALERAIELTGIGPLRHRIFNELSGGERQRVKIALGLAQDPKLLLLDEPTQNLDFGRQMEMIALIRQLHAEGVNIFSAVHDLALISGTFSTVLLISPHERFRIGPPEHVLQPGILERAFQCPAPNLNFMRSFDHRREFAR